MLNYLKTVLTVALVCSAIIMGAGIMSTSVSAESAPGAGTFLAVIIEKSGLAYKI